MRHLLSALLLLALPGGLFVLGRAQQARFARIEEKPAFMGHGIQDREQQLVQGLNEADSPLYLGTSKDHQHLVATLMELEHHEQTEARAAAILALAKERWPNEFPEGSELPSTHDLLAPRLPAEPMRTPERLLAYAETARKAGRYGEAARDYAEARDAWQASDKPEQAARALEAWSQFEMSLQGFPQAEKLLTDSVALQRQHLSDGSQLPRTLKLLSRAAAAQDRLDPEGQHQARVVKLAESILVDAGRLLPLDHPALGRLKLTLADLLLERGDEARAILYYRAGLEKLAFPDVEDQKRVAPAQVALGQLLAKRGEVEPAIAAYKAAEKLYLSLQGTGSLALAHTERELGRLYLLPGVDEVHGGDALRTLTSAEHIYSASPASEPADRIDAQLLLAQAQIKSGNIVRAQTTLELLDDQLPQATSAQADSLKRLQKELDRTVPLGNRHRSRTRP